MATQCLGRLVRDTRGTGLLSFEDGTMFHIPIRCSTMTRNGDICESCSEKERKTIEKVRGITGTTIKGMLPSYLNGRVTDPIPFWSRLYDGAWFRLKLASGCTLSEEVMAKAKKATAIAYEGVEVVEPQPMPGGRKIKSKKPVAANPVAAETPVPVAATPSATPSAQPKLIKKRQPKALGSAPVATLAATTVTVEDVYTIHVRRIEFDGRSLYLDPKKEKLYDLKFKYLGRLKNDTIIDFPDSDADI